MKNVYFARGAVRVILIYFMTPLITLQKVVKQCPPSRFRIWILIWSKKKVLVSVIEKDTVYFLNWVKFKKSTKPTALVGFLKMNKDDSKCQ